MMVTHVNRGPIKILSKCLPQMKTYNVELTQCVIIKYNIKWCMIMKGCQIILI